MANKKNIHKHLGTTRGVLEGDRCPLTFFRKRSTEGTFYYIQNFLFYCFKTMFSNILFFK